MQNTRLRGFGYAVYAPAMTNALVRDGGLNVSLAVEGGGIWMTYLPSALHVRSTSIFNILRIRMIKRPEQPKTLSCVKLV